MNHARTDRNIALQAMRDRMALGYATDDQLIAVAVSALGGGATAELIARMVLREITPTGAN
jgi:hypothetical protein